METKDNNSKQEIEVNAIALTEEDKVTGKQLKHSATEIKKKRSPWPFLGLAMLAIAGGVVGKGFTVSQSPSSPEQLETPAAKASLPVQAVRAKLNPIEAWVFSNGEVAAVHFKHLTFQTAGTITYLKKIVERDLDVFIVMLEGIHDGIFVQKLGFNQAAIKTVRLNAIPALAGQLTTILAMAPLMAIAGKMGKFVRLIPISAMTCLILSYALALLVVVPLSKFLLGMRIY